MEVSQEKEKNKKKIFKEQNYANNKIHPINIFSQHLDNMSQLRTCLSAKKCGNTTKPGWGFIFQGGYHRFKIGCALNKTQGLNRRFSFQ